MTWQDMLLEVSSRPQNKVEPWQGTAFAIDFGIAMTARHLVYDDDGQMYADILIRWPSYKVSSDFPASVRDTVDLDGFCRPEIIWEDADHDVALMRVPHPSDVGYIYLASPPLNIERKCWTRGFPKAAEKIRETGGYPLSGVLHAAGRSDKYLHFDPNNPPDVYQKDSLWGGLSGAPVIDSDTGHALGILLKAGRVFGQERSLKMLPVRSILRLNGFSDQLAKTAPSLPPAVISRVGKAGDRLVFRSEHHVLREEALADAYIKFRSHMLAGRRYALILTGLPGSGKSLLADDIVDALGVQSLRLFARREVMPRLGVQSELALLDGLFDDIQTDVEAMQFLSICDVNYFLITSRRGDKVEKMRAALSSRGFSIDTLVVGGLQRGEFERVLKAAVERDCMAWANLNDEETSRLFSAMGGSPLALQIALKCITNSEQTSDFSLHLHANASSKDFLKSIMTLWQSEILRDRDHSCTRLVLMCICTVPRIAMDMEAVKVCISRDENQCTSAFNELIRLGLISRVDRGDVAYRPHDEIRKAFQPQNADDELLVRQWRRCYIDYKELSGTTGSVIARLDRLISLSAYIIAGDDLGSGIKLVEPREAIYKILALDELFNSFSDTREIREDIEDRLVNFISHLLHGDTNCLTCNEVLALSKWATNLTRRHSHLAEAFARIWEDRLECDPTKIAPSIIASAYHWASLVEAGDNGPLSRFEGSWGAKLLSTQVSDPALIAAGYAAAYAHLGRSPIGAALATGYLLKSRGTPPNDAFLSILLTLDANEDPDDVERFMVWHGHHCCEVDGVTRTYLISRGHKGFGAAYGEYIDVNLNRLAVLAALSRNSVYFAFLKTTAEYAKQNPDNPIISRIEVCRLREILKF